MMVRRHWHSCSPVDLHRMARRYFLHTQRIELQKMARELGISRATAYRWAGSAEQLAGKVLASMVEETITAMREETAELKGRERVLAVLTGGMQRAHDFPALRKFLHRNPETGLKVVASKDGPVQETTITCIQQLLEEEIEAGHMQIDVAPAMLAYALTRVIEPFLYSDLITGSDPDLESAAEVLQLMLPAA